MNRVNRLPSFRPSKLQTFQLAILCVVVAICLTLAGCGGSSGGSGGSGGGSPSNLTYSQSTITATAGQAITSLTPSVTGTVTSFSVTPALPAGLVLSTTTGVISGTPTAVTAETTYTVSASNSAGSTATTIKITVAAALVPPSNLTYPQSTIIAYTGQAITADTPTVTGTVTSYTVAPALPAGLALDPAAGTISGTPTAVTAPTAYVITAANSAGSTTATVQIVVSVPPPPPTGLSYPHSTIVAIVGQAIPSYIPVVTGIVSQYTSNPALPAGLTFNFAGAISGTPTAAAPKTTYTITASNPGGSTTVTVTITINKALPILLDVGNAAQISTLRVSATRVLSQDTNSHWVLWDNTVTPAKQIISGDQVIPPSGSSLPPFWPVDMAGNIFVIGQTNGFDVRSTTDGSIIYQIQSSQVDSAQGGTWWKLATDGSYVCAGSSTALTGWDNKGNPLGSLTGNYSAAITYAAPGQILVAKSPVGANVIEIVPLNGTNTFAGPVFSGTFNSWFTDGQHFFTNTGNTVYTYSSAYTSSAPLSTLTLPTVQNLTGQGNWFWTYSATTSPYQLTIYPINSSAALPPYNLSADAVPVASANTIGILHSSTASASVIDLSAAPPTTPTKTDYTLPVPNTYEKAYAATSATQWIVGNQSGVILDGTTASSATPRYFGTGAVVSIAGGTNYAAVGTASGQVFLYTPASASTAVTPTPPVGTLNLTGAGVALSTDDSVLAVLTGTSLNIYAVPSLSPTYSIPPPSGASFLGFTLSGSGTVLGQYLEAAGTYTRQVAPNTSGAVVTWTDHPPAQSSGINLSPDGTHIAVSSGPYSSTSTTAIYMNDGSGTLIASVPGFAVGWVDNNQILVNNYTSATPPVYSSSAIYSPAGVLMSTPVLSGFNSFQPVSSTSIYAPSLNEILSLPSGAVTYLNTTPFTGTGAIAGANVVFVSGSRVVVDTH